VAKGINKVLPKEKTAGIAALEKLAAAVNPDFEYLTEAEKTAFVTWLGRLGGVAARAGRAAVAAPRALAQGAKVQGGAVARELGQDIKGFGANARELGQSLANRLRGGAIAGATGRPAAAGQRLARIQGKGVVPGGAPSPAPALAAPAVVSAPSAVAKGGVPTPVPTTTGAKARGASKWNPFTARNVARGAGATAIGLGAYGGFKGIQTAGNLMQQHHEPLQIPGVVGQGRVF
jgi:hypothetical protein